METIGRKLFSVLNYAKLFLFTTSTKSQTPLLQFFLRGGGGGRGGPCTGYFAEGLVIG